MAIIILQKGSGKQLKVSEIWKWILSGTSLGDSGPQRVNLHRHDLQNVHVFDLINTYSPPSLHWVFYGFFTLGFI